MRDTVDAEVQSARRADLSHSQSQTRTVKAASLQVCRPADSADCEGDQLTTRDDTQIE